MASRECALATGRKQALALRDLVVVVAKAKGVSLSTNQPGDLCTYHDARIRHGVQHRRLDIHDR
jgi:hypothetical protein